MVTIDANGKEVREINRTIRDLLGKEDGVLVENPRARHHLGVGVLGDIEITFNGSVGYFVSGLCRNVKVKVNGSAGWYLADNFMNGDLLVNGNCGACAAPGMRSGRITIKGNVGSRLGQVMKGGVLVVEGNAGFMTGFTMIQGKVVILGDVDEGLGHYMMGGVIYVGGAVAGLGTDAKEESMDAEDRRFIASTLDELKLPSPGTWKKIVCAREHLRYKESIF
jgi:glutamate synthase domain-containing protein 3